MTAVPREDPRRRLIEAGLRLLDRGGPEALNARRLAAEVGASTQVVYTHFGGMGGFYEALITEAFVRFGERLAAVPRTDDAVADILSLGLAYREFALTNPQRYRFMFRITAPGAAGPVIGRDLTTEGMPSGVAEVNATFVQLIEAVRRAAESGRIRADDTVSVAGQFWSMVHGYVLLEMSGVFGNDGHGVVHVLAPHALNLLVGLGDRYEDAERSVFAVAPDPLIPPGVTIPMTETPRPRRGRRPRP
ncbi:MAG TPA: WHG domain-containing protein [Thermomonospora sp.]|nr:WHG domain-containing protein [Thermomonospora sp.]